MSTDAAAAQTLRAENAELRARLEEAEEMLRAIRAGEVDALVVEGDAGPQLYTLEGLDAESARFRGEMLAQVSDAVIAIDNEERVTFLNAAAERQYRVRAGDVLGRSFAEIYTRQWPSPEAEAGMWTALRERGEWRGELIHRAHDGHELHVEKVITTLRAPDGTPTGYVAAIRDTTERKQAESALRESEARFRQVVEAMPPLVWTCRADGPCDYLSPQWIRYTGRPEAEHLGYGWLEQLHPEDRERTIAQWQATAAEGKTFDGEFRIRRHDGEYRWFHTQAVPLRDEAGVIIKWFGSNTDITERKEAEETLRRRAAQLDHMARTSQRLIEGQGDEHGLLEAIFAGMAQFIGVESFYHFRPCAPRLLGLEICGGVTDEERARFATMRFGELLCGRVAETRAQLVIEDLQHCTQPGAEVLRGAGAKSYAGFPMLGSDGALLGTLAFVSRGLTHFHGGDVQMIQAICNQVAIIVERSGLLRELRESETRFRGILRQSPAGIVQTDAEGRMILVNERWCQMLGYAEAELLGKTVLEVTHTSSVEATREAVGRLAAGGPDFEIEKNYCRKDGTSLSVQSNVTALRTPDGEFRGLIAVVVDMSERLRAEEALRESEEQSRLAMDAAGAGSWRCAPATGEFTASDRALALHGLPPATPMTQECALADDREAVEKALQRTLETGAPFRLELRVPLPDGSMRWVESHAERRLSGHDAQLIGLVRDITERKRAEEELAANAQRMRLATEATQVGIWEWHVPTGQILWDAQMFRIYGVAPTEDGFVSYDTWRRAVLPEDLARQEEVLQDTLQRCAQSSREFRILRAEDGECRWVQAVETVRVNANGQAEWVVGTNLDVTERRRASEAIRDEARRKDEFLAMLGHELRNPLNAIRHAVQIGHETPDDREACQWAARVIDRQSQQLSRMVDDLLDVARINRGRIELRPETLDLATVLERAVAVVRPLIAQRRHTLTTEIGSPLRVTGDAARLEQVFVNLLNNAAKYTPEGGSVTVRAHREDGEAVITITDNGVGIAEDLLPQVFDLFRQAENSLDRAQGGLGIGLNVVKSLVEMHLGRVVVESAGPGAGTTVTVRLPLIIEMEIATGATASPSVSAALPKSTRVLVVDDHEDAAQALARLLRRRGCEVALAHTGPDGVARAREFHPEVCLLDLGLPGFDGYELARRLRADGCADALFIAISGYAQEGDRARCLAAGFDDHFAKPVDFHQLLTAIRGETLHETARGG